MSPDRTPLSVACQEIPAIPKRRQRRDPLNRYSQLQGLIKTNGLLEKQTQYYVAKILFNWGLLAIAFLLLTTVQHFSIQVLAGFYLAFVSTQIGFIVHDAGHQQISSHSCVNDFIG